jgi:HD domain
MKITSKLLAAISFSARAHQNQFRKDGSTPYHAHPMRVAAITASWGVEDESALIAAILHDTIEDTTTDYDDIESAFGEEAARMTALLTKNSCLPEAKREASYYKILSASDWRVRVIKLADGYDNLLDSKYAKVPVTALAKAEKGLALLAFGDEPPLVRARSELTILIEEVKTCLRQGEARQRVSEAEAVAEMEKTLAMMGFAKNQMEINERRPKIRPV